jgi:hypothetical protein
MALFTLCFLINLNIYPQNALSDYYMMIAPLGTVKSMATSNFQLFALNDEYLLFMDKNNLRMEKAVYVDRGAELVGYDNFNTDLWIVYPDKIIRFSTATYNIREFPIDLAISRFAVDVSKLYIETTNIAEKYTLDKISGTLTKVNSVPGNLNWYKKLTEADMRQYSFLSPYYYTDDVQITQTPFEQYPITALYDDGMYLYVGTYRYGILKYNKISWQSEHIITGPLDAHIKRVRKTDDKTVLVSNSGISYYDAANRGWHYQRFKDVISDLISFDDILYVARSNSVLRTAGSLEFPTETFNRDILTLSKDSENIYVGTRSGAFMIIAGSGEAIPFGPATQAVYTIHTTADAVYIGGEIGMYKYDREDREWSTVLNFGIKDIVQVRDDMYSLGTNNQLIRYSLTADSTQGTADWSLLPYFNVHDIDTDDSVVYCATYAGAYYYEPATGSYRIIYNLPRVQYEYVHVIEDRLMAISGNLIYSLPLEYRD